MGTLGTALLTDDIPASRAVTTIVSRVEIADALKYSSPELFLDLEHGDERGTINISWTHDELEQLLDRAGGDDILFAFDRDQLQLAFDDVEAHGLREKALVFTVAVAGALGSGATIANAAPSLADNPGAASVAVVEDLAAKSIDGVASNAHTPGLQIVNERPAASVPSANVSAAKAADDGILSNVHTPGLQVGPGESAAPTPPVRVSASSSSDDVLGFDTRDATEALIAGGLLLAIAGATFAGTRRPGSARPA
jgi:hypothetical protein